MAYQYDLAEKFMGNPICFDIMEKLYKIASPIVSLKKRAEFCYEKENELFEIINKENKLVKWYMNKKGQNIIRTITALLLRSHIASCIRSYEKEPYEKFYKIRFYKKFENYEYPKSIKDEAGEQLEKELNKKINNKRVIEDIQNYTNISTEDIKDSLSHPINTETEHKDPQSLNRRSKGWYKLNKINKEREIIIGTIDLYNNIKSKTNIIEAHDELQEIFKIDQKDEKNEDYYNDIIKMVIEKFSSNKSFSDFILDLTCTYPLLDESLEEIIGMKL